MTNPTEKYGFGPKTRDGREVVITGTTKDLLYPVRGRIGEEVCTWAKCGSEFLGQKSDTDLIPLSELATCKESLQVQSVSQEDLDSLLGLRKEEASDEIERLQAELIEYKSRVNFRNEVLAHMSKENRDNSATIATQQALLIALVECKDAMLKELVELKAQRASYPAKVTREMATALLNISYCAGETPFDCTMRAIDAALAAAPKDDRAGRNT